MLITAHACAALVTSFNLEIRITGAILTKLDGDSRGGAALSVKEAPPGAARGRGGQNLRLRIIKASP
ncbi:hypothetical protein ACLOJK_020680 [Asimina triloba]